MKFSFFTSAILASIITMSLLSCSKRSDTPVTPGAWDKQIDFIGASRSAAVTFTINDTVYMGTGFSYDSGRMADLWKYDPLKNSWSKKAPFPGIGRSDAVGFAVNGKGYIGTGVADNQTILSDFYEFDPTVGAKGKWKAIADLPSARAGGLSFVVKGRAFVGSGNISTGASTKDLWEYDYPNNAWIVRDALAGSKRGSAFVMVINDIAYVGGGIDLGSLVPDFYKFDVTQNGGQGAWSVLSALTGKDVNGNPIQQPAVRASAATFTIGNYGYLMCGEGSQILGDTWQYDPANDAWRPYFNITKNTPTAGSERKGAIGFVATTSAGTFGYLLAGELSTSIQYHDFWKFNPAGTEPNNQ